MKNKKLLKFNKKLTWVLMACPIVFAALQTVLLTCFYDAPMRLYAHSGTAFALIYNVLLFVFVIGALALYYFTDCDHISGKVANTTIFTRIFGILSSVSLLAKGVFDLIPFIKDYTQTYKMLGLKEYIEQVFASKQQRFLLLSAIVCFVAFVYLALVSIMPKGQNQLKTWLGCVTIVWHILYLLATYFDMTGPLNDPIRLINQFALVGMMMFLTVEIRFLCEIPKKGLYIGISIGAFTLLLCSSVATIVYMIASNSITSNIVLNIYQLVSAGYVFTRLMAQLKSFEIKAPETPVVNK
ncbi:MAG: hypothetical protein IKT46_08415 [Clostridia bacterium]|nr:hypothetical protein [Clostridia bacterium]